MTDEECRLHMLRDALAVLALSPDEQIRAEAPGCAVCDVLGAFDSAYLCAVENGDYGAESARRAALDRIEVAIKAMEQADIDCDTVEPSELLCRPAWHEVRELARQALHEFGWQDVRVTPSVEFEPGKWHRSLAE